MSKPDDATLAHLKRLAQGLPVEIAAVLNGLEDWHDTWGTVMGWAFPIAQILTILDYQPDDYRPSTGAPKSFADMVEDEEDYIGMMLADLALTGYVDPDNWESAYLIIGEMIDLCKAKGLDY